MKCLSLILATLLTLESAAARATVASSDGEDSQTQQSHTARLKAEIQKRGTGEKSRVRVTLRNGTVLKGRISKIEDSSFDVTDQAGRPTSIPYADAQKVRGPGLSKGTKIGIVVAVAVTVTVSVFAIAFRSYGY